MNHLPPAGEGTWKLTAHAHIIVDETAGREGLITIYDCGAAQHPPKAQLLGKLDHIDAEHEHVAQPIGYILKLRELAVLRRLDGFRWSIRRE